MENKFLAILEQRNGIIKKSSLQASFIASKFANELNGEVSSLVVGAKIDNQDEIAKFGIQNVNFIKNESLDVYSSSAYTQLIAEFIKANNFTNIFIANSSFGKDLAPRLSAVLDCGLAMDCVELNLVNNEILATRPIFAGKLLMQQKLTSETKIYNLRPNSFAVTELSEATTNVNTIEPSNINLSVKTTDIKKSIGKLDVAEADIIVSGGRGLKAPENFGLIENLASELNAAVGASRAVVDAGWRPHSEQVGQTGKTVSPNLYFAVGISGAIQHVAGMRSSKYIVAINKDKDAPIFQIADYGIVADAFEILPKLTEEIKKLKQ